MKLVAGGSSPPRPPAFLSPRGQAGDAAGQPLSGGGLATTHWSAIGVVAALTFCVLAARWLLTLRGAALDAKLPLSPLDKLLAAAPVAYTVLCLYAAGVLGDRTEELAGAGSSVTLPLVGTLDHGQGLWLLGLLIGLSITTPIVVIFTVETYFGRRRPEMVALGRRAIWSLVTGVKPTPPREVGAASPGGAPEDEQWARLLRR